MPLLSTLTAVDADWRVRPFISTNWGPAMVKLPSVLKLLTVSLPDVVMVNAVLLTASSVEPGTCIGFQFAATLKFPSAARFQSMVAAWDGVRSTKPRRRAPEAVRARFWPGFLRARGRATSW